MMDLPIAELFNGPKSANERDLAAWLYLVHDRLAQAPEPQLREIAEPLKKAAELVGSAKASSADQQAQVAGQVRALIAQAQRLTLESQLEAMQKARELIVAEAKKFKAGSDFQKNAHALRDAYDGAIAALKTMAANVEVNRAGAYEAARAEFERIAQAAKKLSWKAPKPA